jgi:hypothetical protein
MEDLVWLAELRDELRGTLTPLRASIFHRSEQHERIARHHVVASASSAAPAQGESLSLVACAPDQESQLKASCSGSSGGSERVDLVWVFATQSVDESHC